MNKKIKKLVITSAFLLLVSTSTTFIINDIESAKITKLVESDDEETKISIIAHRGFSSLEIENSLEAIDLGLKDNSTTGVEIDIRLTKDQEIVVIHDDKLNDKKISESTLEELQQKTIKASTPSTSDYIASLFDDRSGNLIRKRFKIIKDKETKISTLKEVLDLYKNYQNKELIIEFKFEDNEEEFTKEFYELIQEYNYPKLIIQSDNYEALINMKKSHPEFEYHLIIRKNNYDLINNLDLDGYVIRKNIVDYDDIKILLDNNKKVSIWTISTYDEYYNVNTKLKDLNNKVSYITNYPDALKTWNDLIPINKSKTKVKD